MNDYLVCKICGRKEKDNQDLINFCKQTFPNKVLKDIHYICNNCIETEDKNNTKPTN